MKRFGNILWGLVFILIGTIFAINALGIANINIFFNGWWTLFIIIPCFIGLFRESSKLGNFIGLIIGVALLLCAQRIISFALIWKLALPTIFVIVGLAFIFRDTFNRKVGEKIKELNKAGLKEYAATFSGNKIQMQDEVFEGASLTAVFGGLDFNLNGAKIEGENVINATAIFGGVDIIIPAGVNVKVKSSSLFGGVENKTKTTSGENIPTIYIEAFCMFGGVNIK